MVDDESVRRVLLESGLPPNVLEEMAAQFQVFDKEASERSQAIVRGAAAPPSLAAAVTRVLPGGWPPYLSQSGPPPASVKSFDEANSIRAKHSASIHEVAAALFSDLQSQHKQAQERLSVAHREMDEFKTEIEARKDKYLEYWAPADVTVMKWSLEQDDANTSAETLRRANLIRSLVSERSALLDRCATPVALTTPTHANFETTPTDGTVLALGEFSDTHPVVCSSRSNVLLEGQGQAVTQAALAYALKFIYSRPPGKARVRFIDPTSLGGGLGPFYALTDIDELCGPPACSQAQVSAALDAMRTRVGQVNQQALRGAFADVEAYNAQAPTTEPYFLIVALGLPGAWSADQLTALSQLAQMGPQTGVCVLACVDEAITSSTARDAMARLRSLPSTISLEDVRANDRGIVTASYGSETVQLHHLSSTDDERVTAALKDVATAAAQALLPSVKLSDLIQGPPSQGSTLDGLTIPVGVGSNRIVDVHLEGVMQG